MIRKHRPGPLGKSCLTCKERHKKCDKRQPICERCEVGQFECRGYGHNNRTRTIRPEAPYLTGASTVAEDSSNSSSSGFCHNRGALESSLHGELFEVRRHLLPGAKKMNTSPGEIVNLDHESDESDTSTPGNGQSTRVEDYLYLFTARSTFKPTEGPMSIIRKIVNLQSQLPQTPSDPLKTFLKSQWFVEYILARSDRATDDFYFKPTHHKTRHLREHHILRVQSSDFIRWMTLVSMGVVDFILARDVSQRSLYNFWLEYLEGSLKRELSRDLAPHEAQRRRSDLIQISLLKSIVTDSSNIYQVLRSTACMFLQVVYSDAKFWPSGNNFTSISLSGVLTAEALELALFTLMDCTWAMAFGLPHQIEYDTTYYPQLNYSHPIQWGYGSPIEFQLVLADINACRDKSPTARDWKDIEQWLLTWQSHPGECIFADSWMTMAWFAVQESWRLSLLTYLYMAVCDTLSNDPRIQSCIKQILQVIGTVKKKGPSDANVSFFIQYLIVGICARSETHRQVAREKLLAPKGTKLWIMRAPDFVPVLDHLWHGAAAGGRPIRWNDYMRSREAMLPVI